MAEKLYELPLAELSNLFNNTMRQFIAALKNDRPIGELEHLRDCLLAIRDEIRFREVIMVER